MTNIKKLKRLSHKELQELEEKSRRGLRSATPINLCRSIEELYITFGEAPPAKEKIEEDLQKRQIRWKIKIMRDQI